MSRRVTEDGAGYRRIELDGKLHLEPEIVAGQWDEPTLTLALERTTSAGTFEVTKIRVRIPRSSVTRLLHEIHKLHERERAQIAEDLAALKVSP
jgi:hypothetical protein